MELENAYRIVKEYHLLAWGVGLVAVAFAIRLFLKTACDRWKWEKQKKIN